MIRQIVAMDSKRGIAKAGSQPWKLPSDAAYYHQQTKSHGGVVLMGRTTFEVIGLMKDRQNFILTRDTRPITGAELVHDLDVFLATLTTDLWIIGGAQLYEATLAVADELYITKIAADLQCDKFYPEYEKSFQLASEHPRPPENGLAYRFCIYKRKNKTIAK